MVLSALDYEFVDIVRVPQKPDNLYVIVNVLGALNVTLTGGQVRQYLPFNGMANRYRAVIMEFDANTLEYKDCSQIGTYLGAAGNAPGADFKIINVVANATGDALWVGYNLGPYQGGGSTFNQFLVAFSGTNVTGVIPTLEARLDNTGFFAVNIDTLIPSTVPGEARIYNFATLSSKSFAYNGEFFVLTGSTTAENVAVTTPGSTTPVFKWQVERGECTNASRGGADFQFCSGEEDGWILTTFLAPGGLAVPPPQVLYSQNAVGFENSHVEGISSSFDKSGRLISCFASDSPFVISAPSDSTTVKQNTATTFMHPETTPMNNTESLCIIKVLSGSSSTSLAHVSMDGVTRNLQVTANVGAVNQVFFAGSNEDVTVLKVVNAASPQNPLSFTLTSTQASPYHKVTAIQSTTDGELLASGIFQGKITGDSAAPIKYVSSPSNETSSLFSLYYNPANSPSQISPDSFFSFGSPVTDFVSTKTYVYTPSNSANGLSFLIASKYVNYATWLYNNTIIGETPIIPNTGGRRAYGLFWGLYQPNIVTTPTPQIELAPQPPVHIPNPNAPVYVQPTTPGSTPTPAPVFTPPSGNTPTPSAVHIPTPAAAAHPLGPTLLAFALSALLLAFAL